MFEQLGLIGCGLMGGSFALAMKKAGLVKRVVGYSKSPSTTDRVPLGELNERYGLTVEQVTEAITRCF